MKKFTLVSFAVLTIFCQLAFAQIPAATLVQIVRAEDERRFDKTLELFLKNPNEKIRQRAALAAGRIGDENSIAALVELLAKDSDAVRATAAFALGEIESAKGADAILKTLKDETLSAVVRGRAIEAAGKIAAAIAPTDKTKAAALSDAILAAINFETLQSKPDKTLILLGLTAILRARPAGGEIVAAKFLTNTDAQVRADAGNTLARLRSKNYNEQFRAMLLSDTDAAARANAARMLGIGEDNAASAILLDAAAKDADSRVRVSAIRALGSLKDKSIAGKLSARGENLFAAYKKSNFASPPEKNELLEIAAALGRLLPNSNDEKALNFLKEFRRAERFQSPEIEIAFARIAPETYLDEFNAANNGLNYWRAASSFAQGLGEFANQTDESLKSKGGVAMIVFFGEVVEKTPAANQSEMNKAIPDLIRSLAAFKSATLSELLREILSTNDVFVRATAAELLGEQPLSKENVEALKTAFDRAFLGDKDYNDAQLAILDALFKLDKKEAIPTLFVAVTSKDYLVRKKAFDALRDENYDDSDLVKITREKFTASRKNQVLPYSYGAKLGQLLNTPADYARAAARRNGQTKAVVTTEKGAFTIEFFPEDAPLAVDNFIKLAKSNYFNNVSIHRVVPNFVMQDGDPRGDGNGGPGWQIRCEINMISYERGAVGMALSGKDTGGSQWFVTHTAQPHLDGGYTVFGKVNETDMKLVDNLARGDKILNVKIVEGAIPAKSAKTGKK